MDNDLGQMLEVTKKLLENKLKTIKAISKDAEVIAVPLNQNEIDNLKIKLGECYEKMIEVYTKYLDWDIDEIKLQVIWNIGTYCYTSFNTYPYRFITALKGSGKTRLLELTESLVYNGKLVAGMSDSALFRMASDHTLLFDEAEQIARKEKQSQREILNSGYKKSGKIIKVKEKMTKDGKIYENEEFCTYGPKMLANIYGMEEVLGDRCIPSIMERSNNPLNTKLIQDFDNNLPILHIKNTLNELQCILCSVVTQKNMLGDWNNFIIQKYTNLTNIITTSTSLTTLLSIPDDLISFFNKIDNSGLTGRAFELYNPLFIIARILGDEVLEDIIKIAKKKTTIKKEDDYIENRDIALIDFISQMNYMSNFVNMTELTNQFKHFYQADEEGYTWLNSKWLGRALNRLQLIKMKRRVNTGVEIIPDILKAKNKLGMFKTENNDDRK